MAVFCVLAIAGVAGALAADDVPEASRTFVQELRKAGRAEAPITRHFDHPLTGKPVTMHGRIVLEPPDRARIEFEETGEVVTLRRDGGEWLQPQLEQMVRFDAARAMAALRWWALFGRVSDARFEERRAGPREWVLRIAGDGAGRDSARVVLNAKNLPGSVEITEETGGRVRYEIGAWRFTRARGERGFRLSAPQGYEVFDLR